MKYYDLVLSTCKKGDGIEKKLGFEKIFSVGVNDTQRPDGSGICISSDRSHLLRAVKDDATAIAITDFYIDRKLFASMKEMETVLCIPFGLIISSNPVERPRLLYKASALLKYAMSSRIDVSFASFAESELYMNSFIQLIELSKTIGATEDFARKSISTTNKKVGEAYGKD